MPTSDWTPSVSDVGSVLRARTTDSNGKEVGTFTPATRPTDAQVRDLIESTVGDVADLIGGDLHPRMAARAKAVAAIGAAAMVELTYFPEQVAGDRSIYDRLMVLYSERLKRLQVAVEEGQTGDNAPGDALLPSVAPQLARQPLPYGLVVQVPVNSDLIGRDTRW